MCCCFFFFQAEDGIRDLVRSGGLGDVYKRQRQQCYIDGQWLDARSGGSKPVTNPANGAVLGTVPFMGCLLYTSDAADERSSVDLGGRRIIQKKTHKKKEKTKKKKT